MTAAGEHRAGSVRSIATVGDPVLRERAREITPDELRSPEVQGLVDEVDHNPRYPYKPPVPLTVIVNPVLEPVGDETAAINEGYLSVPDLRGTVDRHVAIRLRRVGRDGVERNEVRRGLTAGTFQHEVDRLDGVLFLDRVRDPTTFTAWAQFDRHDRDAFVARARALVERVGS